MKFLDTPTGLCVCPSRKRKLCLVLDLDHTSWNPAFSLRGLVLGLGRQRKLCLLLNLVHILCNTTFSLKAPCVCVSRKRKLCLVLDLDHTLVNSTKFTEVEPALAARLQEQLSAETNAGLEPSQRGLHAMDRIGMWTKLRPGVREFLTAAAQYFELWIHTNGNRSVLLGMETSGSRLVCVCGSCLADAVAFTWQGMPVKGKLQSPARGGGGGAAFLLRLR